ncbi:DUF6427 family protein [Tenacibaculum sp. IB213877]|uniref:DUF6427 family protein n=1 Tax=Tenacibaculum sp. IB213877 TaxID=3097351 RepID=UPI002A5A3277|nr:DUF6427 family protein [Tenacibaculum sp. IB213877]MDY0780336.1 DUF6427 family protein [Tenacibaculum sp. IB213877]
MLTNFFNKSKPITTVIILMFFSCFFVGAIINQIIPLNTALYLPLFLLILGVFNFITSKNNLTFDNAYAFLFFVLLYGFFPEGLKISPTFYSNVALLLFLRKVYSLQSSKNLVLKFFDGGLWLGVSFLIEPFSAVYGVLLYAAILYHQKITIHAVFVPIIGFFTLVFLYFTYCYWYNLPNDFTRLFNWYTPYNFTFYKQPAYIISIVAFILIVIVSIVLKTPKAFAVKNTFRINWILVLINLGVAISLIILTSKRNGSELSYAFFPAAIIIANALELFKKKWFSDIILGLFIIGAFVMLFI